MTTIMRRCLAQSGSQRRCASMSSPFIKSNYLCEQRMLLEWFHAHAWPSHMKIVRWSKKRFCGNLATRVVRPSNHWMNCSEPMNESILTRFDSAQDTDTFLVNYAIQFMADSFGIASHSFSNGFGNISGHRHKNRTLVIRRWMHDWRT